jgi:uncharacterized protein YndB with AHSA1/START domain
MKKVLIVLVVLVVGFFGFIMTRQGTFHVERSTKIAAPVDVVFAQVADFHNWPAWSAWEKKDPTMKKTYEGPVGAVGSKYSWEGNKDTGSGNMSITELTPNQKIVQKLEFTAPYEASNTVTFTFKPSGTDTEVLWALEGGSDGFMSKAMTTFMNPDKMIGPDFEAGLASLKTVSEAEAKKKAAEAPPGPPAEAAPVAPEAAAPKH